MSTPASIAKHPVHPILVAFPIGLFAFSLACDVIYGIVDQPVWATVAFYCMGGGIIGGLLAAVPGFIDFLSFRESAIKILATKHMAANILGLIIYSVNFSLRLKDEIAFTGALSLSVFGVIILALGGWIGGEMVYVKGIAVEPAEQLSKKSNLAIRAEDL
jgi:uncharacterized membrane protein